MKPPEKPPRWVETPLKLGIGFHRYRVAEHFSAPCPRCKELHPCLHLILYETGLRICECPQCGFIWYHGTLIDCGDYQDRIKLLTLALEAAREALWCSDDVDDETWKGCVRNMAIMEISCILDGKVFNPQKLPKWTPSNINLVRKKFKHIEELKQKLGIPTFWTDNDNNRKGWWSQ